MSEDKEALQRDVENVIAAAKRKGLESFAVVIFPNGEIRLEVGRASAAAHALRTFVNIAKDNLSADVFSSIAVAAHHKLNERHETPLDSASIEGTRHE